MLFEYNAWKIINYYNFVLVTRLSVAIYGFNFGKDLEELEQNYT